MEELIKAMSDSDLQDLKDKYPDNSQVISLVDSILEIRVKVRQEEEDKKQFTDGLEEMLAKLPHPTGVNNIYAFWGSVEVPTGQPAVEVEIADANGNKTKVMRTPVRKEERWQAKINYAFSLPSSGHSKKPVKGTRGITLLKRIEDRVDKIGDYDSASVACRELKMEVGGDSAIRVLQREGYIIEHNSQS